MIQRGEIEAGRQFRRVSVIQVSTADSMKWGGDLNDILDQNSQTFLIISGFPGGPDGKESTCNAGDLYSIPGLGRSPGEGNGYPLQYSCLGNSMDRGTCWATVLGVTKNWTQLSNGAQEELRLQRISSLPCIIPKIPPQKINLHSQLAQRQRIHVWGTQKT